LLRSQNTLSRNDKSWLNLFLTSTLPVLLSGE
jgi:hypothetical protein